MEKTLEQYLRENLEKITIDHILRVIEKDGQITFYIHPMGANGDTLDFVVNGNSLSIDQSIQKIEEK